MKPTIYQLLTCKCRMTKAREKKRKQIVTYIFLTAIMLWAATIGVLGKMSQAEAYDSNNFGYQVGETKIRYDKRNDISNKINEESINGQRKSVDNGSQTNKTEYKAIKLLTNNPEVETKVRLIAAEMNFKWPDYLVKLATCESRLDPKATNSQNNKPKNSKDRGLFQFNSYWQAKVSDECAFNIECATKKAIEMINAGSQELWVCDSLIKKGIFKI